MQLSTCVSCFQVHATLWYIFKQVSSQSSHHLKKISLICFGLIHYSRALLLLKAPLFSKNLVHAFVIIPSCISTTARMQQLDVESTKEHCKSAGCQNQHVHTRRQTCNGARCHGENCQYLAGRCLVLRVSDSLVRLRSRSSYRPRDLPTTARDSAR